MVFQDFLKLMQLFREFQAGRFCFPPQAQNPKSEALDAPKPRTHLQNTDKTLNPKPETLVKLWKDGQRLHKEQQAVQAPALGFRV